MSFVLLGILNSQATGGVVPVPDFLTSNPVWFDAADATTITESGGSVSQWDNKGTGENLVQATSADQPTTGASTVNDLNVIDFAEDYFETSDKSQWKFMHDGTKYFIATVVKFGTTASPGVDMYYMVNSRGSDSNIGMALNYSDNSGSDALLRNITAGGSTVVLIQRADTSGFFTPNTIQIYSDLTDPDNGTAADRIDYFLNDTAGTVANTATGTPTASDSTFNFTLGALNDGIIAMTGQVAELIVVSGADATEANRQTTVNYLNSKWGVF